MPKFPKLSSESAFPDAGNVNVYKYDNKFDYSRFDYDQMSLQLCAVPWDMGEVHIGNRTMSGVGNVVYFETPEKRDAWFDAIPDSECHRFDTKFRELHRDHQIDVEVPFDMCAKFNYLVVDYGIMPNPGDPLKFEGTDGVRKWFWFVREVEFLAPNTTRLHLLEDAFQTWIYDVDVTGMILERGHAPMFSMSADEFLSNPVENNSNLLTEDVNFGEATTTRHIDALVLNAGDMHACIATTADPKGTWGSKSGDDWKVPASASYTVSGVPSVYVFAVAASDLSSFLVNVTSSFPQFKQTVQGVFFASSDLLTLGSEFTFAGTLCHDVGATRKAFELTKLDKGMFGYDSHYEDIAKLYTSPYAHIEVTDENGAVDVVKIEDSTGTLTANVALSIAYPHVNVESHLTGIGGAGDMTVTFRNVDERSFSIGGQWYDTLRTWNVPVFAVVLDPESEYDYATHFNRAQRVVDYTTAYDNATANAGTAKTTADASADANKANVNTITTANKANADKNADTVVDNAAIATATADSITSRSNQCANESRDITKTYNTAVNTADNLLIDFTSDSTIAANEKQGFISAASQMGSAYVSAATSLLDFSPGSAMGAVPNGLLGAGTTIANTMVANGLTNTQGQYAKAGNNAHTTASNTKTTDDTANTTATNSKLTEYQNSLTTGTAANDAAATKANATRTKTAEDAAALNTQTTEKSNNAAVYNTSVANANRTKTQAQSAISNDTSQAALKPPSVFGSFSNGESAVTKPMALFAHVVTQSKGAISAAGDEMLRYGYTLDKQWDFDGNWNVGRYFTYWKLRDFWVANLNVPDMYMDRLRFFLYGDVSDEMPVIG